MKRKLLNISVFILSALLFISCEDRTSLVDSSTLDVGDADFSNFVSIGNSLTAGVQNNGLYESSQNYSFGKLIADQVGATYEQPIYSDPGSVGRLEISSFTADGIPVITPNTSSGTLTNSNYAQAYNNLGIPGIVLADVLLTESSPSDYVGENLLIDAVLRGQGTVFDQALSKNPTMTAVWIGNNDILGHATSGGTLPYTPVANFTTLYGTLIGGLAEAGTEVVAANIPDVENIPFFTTVGPTVGATLKPLVDAGLAMGLFYSKDISDASNYGLASPDDLIDGTVLMTLTGSSYASLIGTPTSAFYDNNGIPVPPGIDTNQPFGLHPQNPWPDALTLDPDEIGTVNTVIESYNGVIANTLQTFDFALVDVNGFFDEIKEAEAVGGMIINGITFTTAFVAGNLFSLDGVHPTTQGYGIVANEFIKVINDKYDAAIPEINVSTLPGSLPLSGNVSAAKFAPGALEKLVL